jgi:hypothetical protein
MVELIREFKPTTVITMDPKNMENEENADHRLVAMTGFEAAAIAAYPNVFRDQFEDSGITQHFVSRVLFYMSPDPDLFINIKGDPLKIKIKMGLIYHSQLELMLYEIDQRIKNMGFHFELLDAPPENIWKTFCQSIATENAKLADLYYQKHPELAPEIKPKSADAFRLHFLGTVEKIRGFLPKEYLQM